MPYDPFASWPPDYCADSAGAAFGTWGDSTYLLGSATRSLRALCSEGSPAPRNTFAAMPCLQVFTNGAWIPCRDGEHVVNSTGEHSVLGQSILAACGSGNWHRLRSGHRITYGGNAYYDDRYTGVL